jgi:YHS domain-containing protein
MAKDPVCGMDVDEKKAKSEYKGVIYYFCCRACKEAFDKTHRSMLSRGQVFFYLF